MFQPFKLLTHSMMAMPGMLLRGKTILSSPQKPNHSGLNKTWIYHANPIKSDSDIRNAFHPKGIIEDVLP
jgi:hypothetical protein